MIMDLHEFDPGNRRAPGVLDRLARAGFSYAIDEFVPLTWREPLAGATTPFPGKAMQWAMTVRAWRCRERHSTRAARAVIEPATRITPRRFTDIWEYRELL